MHTLLTSLAGLGATGRLAAAALMALSIGAVVPSRSAAAQRAPRASSCITPDSAAQEFRQHIIRSIVGTTEEDSVDRAGWGLARGVDTAVVAFVSDASICRRAAVSHAAAAGTDTLAPAPVYLLRVGRDRMIAFNYTPLGEFTLFAILDGRGHFLERLVG